MSVTEKVVITNRINKIRKLLSRVGIRLSIVDPTHIRCAKVSKEKTVYCNIEHRQWEWLAPLLEELIELRARKNPIKRTKQDFQRDTMIVTARDVDKMTYADIGAMFGISAPRARDLYVRRKAQQESNRQKVHMHAGIVMMDGQEKGGTA